MSNETRTSSSPEIGSLTYNTTWSRLRRTAEAAGYDMTYERLLFPAEACRDRMAQPNTPWPEHSRQAADPLAVLTRRSRGDRQCALVLRFWSLRCTYSVQLANEFAHADQTPMAPRGSQRWATGLPVAPRSFDGFFSVATASRSRPSDPGRRRLDARLGDCPVPAGTRVYELDLPKVLRIQIIDASRAGALPTAERIEVPDRPA